MDHFVWSVRVGVWTQETEGNDLRLREHLLELAQEWDRAAHAVGSGWLAVPEGGTGILDCLIEPWGHFLHAPSGTGMAAVDSDLGTIWWVRCQSISHNLFSLLWVHGWRQSHRNSGTSRCSDDITGHGNRWKTISASDGHIWVPNIVQVHFANVFVVVLGSLNDSVFFAKLVSSQFGHELGLGFLPLWKFNVQGIDDFTSFGVIKSIEQLSQDSEGFWNDSTYFTTMVTINSNLNIDIQNANTSKRTGDPELLVIESSRVHAEASIWDTNGILSDFKESYEIWTSRFLLGLEHKAHSWKWNTLILASLDGEHA